MVVVGGATAGAAAAGAAALKLFYAHPASFIKKRAGCKGFFALKPLYAHPPGYKRRGLVVRASLP